MQFRVKALAKAREPDELDRPIVLVEPRTWTAMIVALICLVGSGVWAVTGKMPTTVTADGFLTTAGGTAQVTSTASGQVTAVSVRPGDEVADGATIAQVRGGVEQTIRAPYPGRVITVGVSTGDTVGVGQSVVTLERTGTMSQLTAYVFVPGDRAAELQPGGAVTLAVAGVPTAAFGMLRGRIASITPYPAGSDAIDHIVGGADAAAAFPGASQDRIVQVRLSTSTTTASGFSWTTPHGLPGPLTTQHQLVATFDLGSRAPISILMGNQ